MRRPGGSLPLRRAIRLTSRWTSETLGLEVSSIKHPRPCRLLLDASHPILLYWRIVTSIKDLLLGQIAVEKGYLTKAQLADVMREQSGSDNNDPNATVTPTKGTRPL